jgi:hypothetical protein
VWNNNNGRVDDVGNGACVGWSLCVYLVSALEKFSYTHREEWTPPLSMRPIHTTEISHADTYASTDVL